MGSEMCIRDSLRSRRVESAAAIAACARRDGKRKERNQRNHYPRGSAGARNWPFLGVFGRLPGKILATGADYLGFQLSGADYLASAIRRGRLPGPAKRWGRIPGPNFRQKAGQITWAGRLPGPRPKAGQNTCLHVFRSVATQAPNRTKPVLGVFLRAAWPGMTNGRGKGRRGPGSAAYANERRDKNLSLIHI